MPNSQPSSTTRAYVILAIGIFCISFSAIFVKWPHLPGVTSGFQRLAMSIGVLLQPFVRQRANRPPLKCWAASTSSIAIAVRERRKNSESD